MNATLLGQLTRLESLDLSFNELTDNFPFAALPPTLTRLEIKHNRLRGNLADLLAQPPSSLRFLDANANQLVWQSPSKVHSAIAASLTHLTIHDNAFNLAQVPTEWCALTALTRLGVGQNQISGKLFLFVFFFD